MSKSNLVICIAPYYGTNQIWVVCNDGITQFYLPPTQEPDLPHEIPRYTGITVFLWRYIIRAAFNVAHP